MSPEPAHIPSHTEAAPGDIPALQQPEAVGKGQEQDSSSTEASREERHDVGEQVTSATSPLAEDERGQEDRKHVASGQEVELVETKNGLETEEQDISSPEPPPPPPKDEKYISKAKGLGLGLDAESDDEKEAIKSTDSKQQDEGIKSTGDDDVDDLQSEITSIMEQFEDGKNGLDEQEIMSPRLEIGQPMFGTQSTQHPPRKSSLEPIRRADTPESVRKSSSSLISLPPRSSSLAPASPALSLNKQQSAAANEPENPLTPTISKILPPPPQPDPEPDLPFDFQRFLEQLRHKSADPVAKYLRSFLLEFGKKPWMVHEQVKIISDFLEFITKKMASCEVWRTVSDAEFDNAREGMEKLVMNRLYSQTFSPAIPSPEPVASRSKRRAGDALRPGRTSRYTANWREGKKVHGSGAEGNFED
jgi:hypothetical protein